MKEYSRKFTQLAKYAPTMVADSRAKMNQFVTGISDIMVNECSLAMLIPSMDISCFMVHAEQIEEKKLNQVGRELKKERTEYGNFSRSKFEMQDKPRYKRRFSNQGPPNAPRVNKSKVPTPKVQEEKCGRFYVEKPLCT